MTTIKPRKIIIDTDPGIDDAAAIAIALKNPALDVMLISTVAGNVPLSCTTENALKLMEFFDADVPVAKGCEQPLLRTLETVTSVHGMDGMGGYGLPKPTRKTLDKHSVEVMKDMLLSSDEKITLVVIGVETNIAILLKMYPEVKEKIDEIVIMGGSMVGGNVTSTAEFNIYNDPHAAEIVFKSGVPITMLGLDVTNRGRVYRKTEKALMQAGKTGEMLNAIFNAYVAGDYDVGLKIHDVCTMAYMLKPELFKTEMHYVTVQTEGVAAGATMFDRRKDHVHNPANVKVCVDIDEEGFEDWFIREICE